MQTIFNKQKEFYNKGYTKAVTYRENALVNLKKAIKANEEALYEAFLLDLNKPKREVFLSELFMVYKSINYSKRNLNRWSKDKKVKTPLLLKPAKSYIKHVPYGNALIMSAFNYPLLLTFDPLIGSISGGNVSMVALSSAMKNVNKVILKIINETFEEDYIYAFETNREVNNEILEYQFDKIFFTGSTKVGKIVLEKASKNLVSTTLELGGKSPAIVIRDANIKGAAKDIVYSKVLNGGQTCIATDYVLIDHLIKDEFIQEIQNTYKKMYADLNQLPKIVNKAAYDNLKSIVNDDAQYLVNEVEYLDDKNIMSLAILDADISEIENLKSMEDELFGMILPVITYRNINDAVNYINQNNVPLALYVFGKHKSNINFVLEHTEFGGASVNSTLMHMVNENLPFSGFKQSGLGSYHGKYSFDTFTYAQPIYRKSRFFLQRIIYPPYK